MHEELNMLLADQLSIAAKYLDIAKITEPGHTILWDLIQEDKAVRVCSGTLCMTLCV